MRWQIWLTDKAGARRRRQHGRRFVQHDEFRFAGERTRAD